ncbi:unnamed protein product [Menidia menidia]|uniref:(Atlantic silverside) hypothetical protein n=1 Tax=Menidia menidia TaxID=238744 RepID=A0A8S4ASE2_9TELE|nr:unnamed protein product [Menidia menidia]
MEVKKVERDKSDDELEMTMVCYRPEGLDQLEAQTNFTKQELQILYHASMYAHYLFNAFDTTNNGSIKFKDFVMGLSILLRGTLREKLEWTFHLYDINRDGYINREVRLCEAKFEKRFTGSQISTKTKKNPMFLQEMTEIVRAIYDMMGKYTYPALKGDVPQQHVDAFFQKMDKNKDGVVTLEEFVIACQEALGTKVLICHLQRGPASVWGRTMAVPARIALCHWLQPAEVPATKALKAQET